MIIYMYGYTYVQYIIYNIYYISMYYVWEYIIETLS